MRLLNYFRGTIKDEFWGEIDLSINGCHCFKTFTPANKIVGISLDTKGYLPSELQKEFVIRIERIYPELLAIVHPHIKTEVQSWKPKNFVPDIEAQFVPVFLSIPSCKGAHLEWMFSFSPLCDVELFVSIFVTDLKVMKVISNGR